MIEYNVVYFTSVNRQDGSFLSLLISIYFIVVNLQILEALIRSPLQIINSNYICIEYNFTFAVTLSLLSSTYKFQSLGLTSESSTSADYYFIASLGTFLLFSHHLIQLFTLKWNNNAI